MEARDLTGQVLDGRYRVLGPIGEGAMGSVYRGERVGLGRAVAIKVMAEHVPNDAASRRRFEREAMAMAKLEHPHCASVLDVGMHEDTPYVVMELVSGDNLAELVRHGPVPIPRAVEITRQILSGLAHAHELGIVHRDIKPANVVLSQKTGLGDHAKLLDFGLAKLSQETSNLTTGMIVGTPSYMAPEQIRGLALDGRADLYACGVLLFELLTGTKPFRSDTGDPLAICMMHLNDPPPRLAARVPGVDFGALEAVVARALAKDRDQRFATAGELADALAEATGRQPTPLPRRITGHEATTHLPDPDAVDAHARTSIAPSSPSLAPLGAPPAPAARPARSRTLALALGGGALLVVIVIVAVAAGGGGSSHAAVVDAGTTRAPADAARVAEPPPDDADEVAATLARADELAAGRRVNAALDLLLAARKQHPKDARLAAEAGKLYFAKLWFVDGLKQLRAAIALDPSYRTDPELIRAVIAGYNTTTSVDWTLASFLRNEIGAAAKPFLQEVAASHPNPIVRNRAKAELRHY